MSIKNENNKFIDNFKTLNQFDLEQSNIITEKEIDILPVFNDQYVAICIVSSDEYAPFASVLIQSIISNIDNNKKYDIVILSNDMLMQNRWRIEKQSLGFENISIRIIDISKMVENLQFYTWAHFTDKTYYRLLIPDIFIKYDKVLYLDSDIIVNHDISELFDVNLDDYFIAAAYDTHVVSYCTREPALEQKEYNTKYLGMENPEEYFQAGVCLFNIKLINSVYGKEYLIREAEKHKLRWLDQDLINKLFYRRIKKISNKWNVMIANNPDNLDEYFLPDTLRREYFEARKDPYIIHYIGRSIPCYTEKPDMYEYYWKYARHTEFYEILIQRMHLDYIERKYSDLSIKMIQDYKKQRSFRNCIKKIIINIFDTLFPKGSDLRVKVKNFIFRLRKWK